MRKTILTILTIILIIFISSCEEYNEIANNQYEDLAGIEANYNYEFESNLPERPKDFKKSVGKIYYISEDGDDDNDGLSEDKPFKTVDRVNMLKLNPGDSVLFKKGDIFEETTLFVNYNGSDENPIYYGNYGSEEELPIIKTDSIPAIDISKSSNIVVEGLDLFMESPDRFQDGGSFTGVIYGDFTSFTSKFRNIYIYNNIIRSSSFKSQSNGIKIVSVFNYNNGQNVLPTDLIVNLNIKYNKIYNIGVTGVEVYSWLSDLDKTGTSFEIYRDIFIEYNEIYNIGQIGAYFNTTHNSKINHNYVYKTGLNSDGLVSIGDTGIMTIGVRDSEVAYNVVYDNEAAGQTYDGMGIDIDWNSLNVTVKYNHTYSNDGAGIATMASIGSQIINNRIEGNRLYGNQKGQLQITDFTARYIALDSYFYATKDLVVQNNLIINNLEDDYAVSIKYLRGDDAWDNNVILENHVVNDFISERPKYITVDPTTYIYDFQRNSYFANYIDYFHVFDQTPGEKMNPSAVPIPNMYTTRFSDWQKRDLGSTLSLIDRNPPKALADVEVMFDNNQLKFKWEKDSSAWHYNIHLVDFNERTDYTNIVEEVFGDSFIFDVDYKGEYYFIIQPESNIGVYGEALKIKININ